MASFTLNTGKTSALVIKYHREHISLRILLYLEDPSLWAISRHGANDLADKYDMEHELGLPQKPCGTDWRLLHYDMFSSACLQVLVENKTGGFF